MEVEADELQYSQDATILVDWESDGVGAADVAIRAMIPYSSGMVVVEKAQHKIVMDTPNKKEETHEP